MQRPFKALLIAVVASAVIPCVASAKDVQVGVTKSPVIAPTCPAGVAPANCLILLTKITAFETRRDGVSDPTEIKSNGVIVSFTVGISDLNSNAKTRKQEVSEADAAYGGAPSVELTVLRQVGGGSGENWRVAAKSPLFPVISYLGQVVELPLIAPIPVVRGEVLALTMPTWAPVLSFDLSTSQFSYRQSRSSDCDDEKGKIVPIAPQLVIGEFANYGCSYSGSRVEYSALEVTSP